MYETIITSNQLTKNIDNPDWVIFDCRFPNQSTMNAEAGTGKFHLPNAQYGYLETDLSGKIILGVTGRHPLPKVENFIEKLRNWGVGNHSQVIVYDDNNGSNAARLWWMMNWVGHKNVAILEGGLQNWLNENGKTKTEVIDRESVIFSPIVNNKLIRNVDEIQEYMTDDAQLIVDSRNTERYLGESEPYDPIAGHVPSAINIPFRSNLNTFGNFLSKEQIRNQFEGLLGDTPVNNITFYCGSGVSAALNIMCMKHAGLGFPNLYVGSWSGWITDNSRPRIERFGTGSLPPIPKD